MTPRNRTQPCTQSQANSLLKNAIKFHEVAQLIADEPEPEYANASAALAVLAGIAAADAACCSHLGERSRSGDHHQAESFVMQVNPNGTKAATKLHRLLNMKDQAHYGLFAISNEDLRSALRQAEALIKFAKNVLAPVEIRAKKVPRSRASQIPK